MNHIIKKYTLFAALLMLSCTIAARQKTEQKLQQQIRQLLQGFHGDIGVYVKNLRTGKVAALNADTLFPTASMVKVPSMIGIIDKLEKGAFQYHQPLEYRDSLYY